MNDDLIIIYSEQEQKEEDLLQNNRYDIRAICYSIVAIVSIMSIGIDLGIRYINPYKSLPYLFWTFFPIIVLVITLDSVLHTVNRSITYYKEVDRSGRICKRSVLTMNTVLCAKIIISYGKNIVHISYLWVVAIIIFISLSLGVLLLSKKLVENKWVIITILLVCVLETFYFNLSFSRGLKLEGEVLKKGSGAYDMGCYLELEINDTIKRYQAYGITYNQAEVGDRVILNARKSICGVEISEVVTYEQ